MAHHALPDGRIPVLLSAHAEALVRVDARAIAGYLDRFPETTVAQVAAQLRRTRRVRRYRAVVRAADRFELVDGLRALAGGDEHPLVARAATSSAPRQAFVVPGQGGQWPGMGAVAYRDLPAYRAAADACVAAFEAAGMVSPLGYLTSEPVDPPSFSELEVEGAQFVHAVALAEVWRSCGVLPDLTVGHSLGEVAAAYLAGSITMPDAVAVVGARARVVSGLPGSYAVAALGIGEQAAGPLLAATDGWLELSVVNAPSTVAVSGDRDAVRAAVDAVRRNGDFAREISVGFPVHTSALEPLRDELLARLPAAEFADSPVQFIGGATGDVVAPGTEFGDYWYTNLRHPVRFDRALKSAIRCGARSFIELSANPTLLFAMNQTFERELPEGPAVLVASARRDQPLAAALSANIVTAALADPGYAWDIGDIAPQMDTALRGFPNAPMRATPLWAHPEPLPPVHGTSPVLTLAFEQWERAAPAAPAGAPPVRLAVTDLGGPGPLARPLRAAIEAHPAARLGAPRDAEMLVAIAPTLDRAGAGPAAEALAGLVAAGLLDYPAESGPRCRTVCLVTVGGERAGANDAPPSPGDAALAAMHRSVGFDYPELSFTHLDLPSGGLPPDAGIAAVEGLLRGCGETALRHDGSRYALFERGLRDAPAPPPWPLDSGLLDDVVITGGAGGVGLHYARYFAERGARRVVLLSRRPADPELLNRWAAECGTALVSPPCDITDSARLRAVAAQYGADGASMIVHAAGSASFGAAAGLSPADVAGTFAAKVGGLVHLAELWPARSGARMLLCSSVSGVWGGRGHAAYSAANRLLDVLAAELRSQGRHCVAVKWGLWQSPTDGGRGIVEAVEVANIERSGLRGMAPRAAIEASLREWHRDPLVYSADTARLQVFLDGQRPEPLDKHCAATQLADGADSADSAEAAVADVVRAQLAAVLGLRQPAELHLGQSLFDLGVDSMLAVDLRKRLKRVIGRTVPLAALLDEITGDELVARLEGADAARKVDLSRD